MNVAGRATAWRDPFRSTTQSGDDDGELHFTVPVRVNHDVYPPTCTRARARVMLCPTPALAQPLRQIRVRAMVAP